MRVDRSRSNHSRRRWLGSALAVALVVSACSSTPGATTAPASVAAGTGAQAPADSPTVQRIKAAGKLVGGIGQVLPWTGLDQATNQYFGATVLIANEIGRRIGVPVEFKPVGNDIVVQEVAAGNIDIALYPLYVREARLEVIDMVPWHKGGFCWMVLKDNAKITKLEDLNSADVRIQVFDGFPFNEAIQGKYPNAKLVSRPIAGDTDTGIPDILAGRADVAYADNPLIFALLKEYPQLKSVPDAELCLNDPDLPTDIALGTPKGDAQFSAFLKQLYTEMAPQIKAELAKYSDPQYIILTQ
jgi:polar amino acid transport system substrate-binding protein